MARIWSMRRACAFSALPVCTGPAGAQLGPDGESALRRALTAIAEGRDVTATLSSGMYNEGPGIGRVSGADDPKLGRGKVGHLPRGERD